jgi:hypothetical protein
MLRLLCALAALFYCLLLRWQGWRIRRCLEEYPMSETHIPFYSRWHVHHFLEGLISLGTGMRLYRK